MSNKLTEKNDMSRIGVDSTRAETYNKRRKVRSERRRANRDPETQPLYGKYKGYVS